MIDVERSEDPPASLASTGQWDGQDVHEALARDFLGKCYLCERAILICDTEVDHRIPQRHWAEGKLVWTNLYPSCRFCNGRRPKAYPDGGLLSPGDGVATRVLQRAVANEGFSIACEFSATDPADVAAANVARELSHVHSPDTAGTFRARLATQDMLRTIHDLYLGVVLPKELKVLRARQQRVRDPGAETELARSVSRRAPFTMLLRSLVDPSLTDLFD